MALGPRLNVIAGGQAIIADYVMQNFTAIVDFLRAIPSDNLLAPYWTWNGCGKFPATALGSTTYQGYQRINFGGAPKQLEMTAMVELAGAVAVGQSVTFTWQKCTPSNGTNPRLADAWTNLTNSITFSSANTVLGTDDILGDPGAKPPYRFAQKVALTDAPALADGDWVRCAMVISAAAPAMTGAEANLALKGLGRA